MKTYKTLFAANLEFFRENFGCSQEVFCADVLKINKNSYTNYLNGGMPKPDTLKFIVNNIEEEIAKDSVLTLRFPKGSLTPSIMKNRDVSKSEKTEMVTEFYWRKFLGNYICYYTSTNIKGDKQTQYGVLQLREGERPSKFVAYGVFSLKDDATAFKIYETINSGENLEDLEDKCQIKTLFDGKAYLSTTLLWLNLSNGNRSEHVSLSFDLDSKVVTKCSQEKKYFYGGRCIALSQTSGQGNQTVTFPMVVSRYPLEISANSISEDDLIKFLHFTFSKIEDDSLSKLTQKIIRLDDSIKDNVDLVEMRTEILKRYLNNAFLDYLSKNAYSSYYFLPDDEGAFYKKIIKPAKIKHNTTQKTDNKD